MVVVVGRGVVDGGRKKRNKSRMETRKAFYSLPKPYVTAKQKKKETGYLWTKEP